MTQTIAQRVNDPTFIQGYRSKIGDRSMTTGDMMTRYGITPPNVNALNLDKKILYRGDKPTYKMDYSPVVNVGIEPALVPRSSARYDPNDPYEEREINFGPGMDDLVTLTAGLGKGFKRVNKAVTFEGAKVYAAKKVLIGLLLKKTLQVLMEDLMEYQKFLY